MVKKEKGAVRNCGKKLGDKKAELWEKQKSLRNLSKSETLDKRRRLPTLPHCIAVPSAQVGLTSLFGMGRGGTPPQ